MIAESSCDCEGATHPAAHDDAAHSRDSLELFSLTRTVVG